MRLPLITLLFLGSLLCPLFGGSPQSVADVTFLLPPDWRPKSLPAPASGGVVYAADGLDGARLTISLLAPASVQVLRDAASVDPLTAPELALDRVNLAENGHQPIQGRVSSQQEGGAFTMNVAFECDNGGQHEVILTCTWLGSNSALRARLQYPTGLPPDQTAAIEKLRASFRYAGKPTVGFGTFQPSASLSGAPRRPEAKPSTALSLTTGALVQQHSGSLVIVEGGGGAGSGFICQFPEGIFLVTNQHVASEMPALKLSSLNGAAVAIGPGGAAVGHDIIRFATTSTAPPLLASTRVEEFARIGDPIVVLGNSEGAHVVQPLEGQLIGIGPDRIEVSAEFVPGNSGSPVIHLPTGKVLGIATYLVKRQYTDLAQSGPTIRRFAYRLDTVRSWQPVNWPAYRSEATALAGVESLSKDLDRLIGLLSKNGYLQPGAFAGSPLVRPVGDFVAVVGRKTVSPADRQSAVLNFLAALRSVSQADIIQQRPKLRYDYFQRALSEQSEIRQEMTNLFDRLLRSNGR